MSRVLVTQAIAPSAVAFRRALDMRDGHPAAKARDRPTAREVITPHRRTLIGDACKVADPAQSRKVAFYPAAGDANDLRCKGRGSHRPAT